MDRRNAIATVAAVFVGGACVGAVNELNELRELNDVPLQVMNDTGSEKRVTVAILEQDSEERVFGRTVEVAADEETELSITGLQAGTTYDVVASTASGRSGEYLVSTGTRKLYVEVGEDGISIFEVVT